MPCCVLCSLPQHLERPRVDEEAILVWLPEISQQAINVTMREMHVALQGLGEDVHADAVFRNRGSKGLAKFHHLRAVFTDRREAAQSRVGTMSPRELGLALLELSLAAYSRRGDMLGGLRLLPLGRFFVDDKDTYPEIVGFWRERAKTGPTISNGVR